MMASRYCAACGAYGDILAEQSAARCNVRAFREQTFEVWRCRDCLSIHASDEVELAGYYAGYPFHSVPEDWRSSIVYDQQLRRLRRAGVERHHRILDYGCGEGAFLRHLQRRGFQRAFGYDRYSSSHADKSLLEQSYDCVVAQDVLEHVADPRALMSELAELAMPTGVIAIGTPNAEAIDLQKPERYLHTLHQPYHRHILSARALLAIGAGQGLELERLYDTQYANTPFPFLNSRFYLHYMRLHDDSLNSLMEAPKPSRLMKELPRTLFWGLLGSLFADPLDMMAIFRRVQRGRP
jgi:SAM-dependent methyltransferase